MALGFNAEIKIDNRPYNPLHGLTLKTIVTKLEAHFGFEILGKTPWAREKVEQLYIKNKIKFIDKPYKDLPLTHYSYNIVLHKRLTPCFKSAYTLNTIIYH